MTILETLDEYLSGNYGTDYWSDDAIFYAYKLIGELAPADWLLLNELWERRPNQWQEHLADVLSRAQPAEAIPLLLTMIERGSDALTSAAAGSLRSMDVTKDSSVMGPKAIERLKEVAHRSSRLEGRVLKDLLLSLGEGS